MKISIYDQELKRIAIIDEGFVSCLWSEDYNSTGNFTLELQETEEYRKKIRPDVYVGRSDRKTLMVVKTVKASNGKVVASGKQAVYNLDDVAFVGTIKENSQIDKSIQEEYNKSNKSPSIEFRTGAISDRYRHQISNKSFLELCQTMCQSEDVGFRSVRGDGVINIEFYKPEKNPNLVFSKSFGNLFVGAVNSSTNSYKNYAIVLGNGEGDQRTRIDIDLTGGEDRRELIVDAKDVQPEEGETESSYIERLTARGYEKLLECVKIFNVAFEPLADDFGKRFDLGDILTLIIPEYNGKVEARVVQFTQKQQNNKTTTSIGVGTMIVKR